MMALLIGILFAMSFGFMYAANEEAKKGLPPVTIQPSDYGHDVDASPFGLTYQALPADTPPPGKNPKR